MILNALLYICVAGDYQNVLLEYIDASNLPMFLGGDITDPDGNPRCATKVSRSWSQIYHFKMHLK